MLGLLLAGALGVVPLRAQAPAVEGELAEGLNLVIFSGGTTADLFEAVVARGCDVTSAWATSAGALVGYIPGAPEHVNAEWTEAFAGGIPANTPVMVVCDAVQPLPATPSPSPTSTLAPTPSATPATTPTAAATPTAAPTVEVVDTPTAEGADREDWMRIGALAMGGAGLATGVAALGVAGAALLRTRRRGAALRFESYRFAYGDRQRVVLLCANPGALLGQYAVSARYEPAAGDVPAAFHDPYSASSATLPPLAPGRGFLLVALDAPGETDVSGAWRVTWSAGDSGGEEHVEPAEASLEAVAERVDEVVGTV